MTEMADHELLLADRFAALTVRDPGDWPAVRRRVRRMRARRAALVAGAVLAAALLAAPAFGFGGRVLDLFQGPPAPPEVQTHFAANDVTRRQLLDHADEAGAKLHDRFSPVIASDARGVFAIESPDGPIYLWAAPTEDGRQCWLIQAGAELATGRPHGLSSCDGIEPSGALRPGTFWTAERPSVKIVHVRIYDDAIADIEVEIAGTAPVSLPVVAGYALGTVPNDEQVLALVGRNADGGEVTRFVLRPDPAPGP